MKHRGLDPNTDYVLHLLQNDHCSRYTEIRGVLEEAGVYCVFKTTVIPKEYLVRGKTREIQTVCKLVNGQEFGFGGHGEWYTDKEMESMKQYDLGLTSSVVWETKQAPDFAPK